MNEERVEKIVTETVSTAMNPETMDVLAYLRNAPAAKNSHDVFTNLPVAKELSELSKERAAELAKRRKKEDKGDYSHLSIGDENEDTEFDDRINELWDKLQETKVTFNLVSVAPALRKAINKSYAAKLKTLGDDPEVIEKHNERATADVLSRAISSVFVHEHGVEDTSEWTPERLLDLEDTLHEEQFAGLLDALWAMVMSGSVFDEALTADFS